jgi:hypothetical protein
MEPNYDPVVNPLEQSSGLQQQDEATGGGHGALELVDIETQQVIFDFI